MPILKFSDGEVIDTSGQLRMVCLKDGWYVIGQGLSVPMDTVKEGEGFIHDFKERQKRWEAKIKQQH